MLEPALAQLGSLPSPLPLKIALRDRRLRYHKLLRVLNTPLSSLCIQSAICLRGERVVVVIVFCRAAVVEDWRSSGSLSGAEVSRVAVRCRGEAEEGTLVWDE